MPPSSTTNSSRSWDCLCCRDYPWAAAPILLHVAAEFFGTISNPGAYPNLPKLVCGQKIVNLLIYKGFCLSPRSSSESRTLIGWAEADRNHIRNAKTENLIFLYKRGLQALACSPLHLSTSGTNSDLRTTASKCRPTRYVSSYSTCSGAFGESAVAYFSLNVSLDTTAGKRNSLDCVPLKIKHL